LVLERPYRRQRTNHRRTTPIELLPAAGVGKYYDIEKVVIEYSHVTTAYTISGTGIINLFGNAGGYLGNIFASSLIGNAENRAITFSLSSPSYTDVVNGYATLEAQAINDNISLFLDGTIADGDGTLRVKIYHKTITFGA
jgi:hypothetical protein